MPRVLDAKGQKRKMKVEKYASLLWEIRTVKGNFRTDFPFSRAVRLLRYRLRGNTGTCKYFLVVLRHERGNEGRMRMNGRQLQQVNYNYDIIFFLPSIWSLSKYYV
jgi:hypothetical protein